MNINDAFPSKYISAGDLHDQPVTVTISRCVFEKMRDGKTVPVIYFQGTERGLALNKTNGMSVASLHGPETNGWTGKKIQLYPTMTEWQGKPTTCIRIQAAGVQVTPQSPFPPVGPDINGELNDAADADQDMPPYDPDNPDAIPF